MSDQIKRKKEHDMRALKRQDISTLRQGAPKGRKVLYIWDRAGIDFRQWFKWKESGVYFLSREKENMKLEINGSYSFDHDAPINQGVISDEIVATSVGVTVRRVIYQDLSGSGNRNDLRLFNEPADLNPSWHCSPALQVPLGCGEGLR